MLRMNFTASLQHILTPQCNGWKAPRSDGYINRIYTKSELLWLAPFTEGTLELRAGTDAAGHSKQVVLPQTEVQKSMSEFATYISKHPNKPLHFPIIPAVLRRPHRLLRVRASPRAC